MTATHPESSLAAAATARRGPTLAAAVLLLAALLWSYWPTLTEMAGRWWSDPQYTHGFIVPLFSAYLLWSRRSRLAAGPVRGNWAGVAIVLAGLGLRAAGVVTFFGWLDAISILVCLAGLVVTLAGWAGLRWAWPAILFLGFMAPLPYAVQSSLSGFLQRLGTQASTYLLVTLGVPAVSEGNVILLSNDAKLGVVEACSGLGMLMTFFALSVAVVTLLRSEPLWAKVVVVLSTIPVAVAVNVIRITATGILFDRSQDTWARWVYHDVAGWLMMPIAVLMFLVLLWMTRRVVIPVRDPVA